LANEARIHLDESRPTRTLAALTVRDSMGFPEKWRRLGRREIHLYGKPVFGGNWPLLTNSDLHATGLPGCFTLIAQA
jgi:hypothetical protein